MNSFFAEKVGCRFSCPDFVHWPLAKTTGRPNRANIAADELKIRLKKGIKLK